jgi:hypothetical protein
MFPEFYSTVTSAQATAYSTIAAGYIDLGANSPMANNLTVMALVWNLTTAHVAQLFAGSANQPVSPFVGRVDSAAEGSVNISATLPEDPSLFAAWFNQTKYGLAAWAMMAQFRQALYVPAPRYGVNPIPGMAPAIDQGFPLMTYPFL